LQPLILFLLIFSSAVHGGETPLPTFVIRLTIFSLSLAALRKFRDFYPVWPPIDLPAILFLLLVLVSTSWAAYHWAAYQHALNILCVGLVYFLVRGAFAEGDGKGEANRLMAVVLFAGTAQVAWELFQYFSGESARPGGAFANPNFLAGYLFFSAVISVHFAACRTSRKNPFGGIIFFCLAALMAYGIYITRSRANVAVAGGILVFMILVERKGRKAPYLAGAAGVVALLLASVAQRFSTVADPYALGRLYIWKAAWETAVSHPLGVGLGGYKFFWLRLREPIENAPFHYGRTAATAHSQFFGILSELGFPGIVLAVLVAVSVLYLACREARREDRILPLCLIPLAAMVHAFFEVNFDVFAIALPVAVCTALLASRNARAWRGGISLSPVVRVGFAMVLLPCVAYSAASGLGRLSYQQGLGLLKEGNTNRAMDEFSLAKRVDPFCSAYPDAASSVYFRWYLQTGRGEFLVAAVNEEQEAHEASPEDPLHLSQVGFLLGELAEASPADELRRSLRRAALAAFRESLLKDPYSIVALMRKAEILRRSGNSKDARAVLERLIAVEPNAAQAYLKLAWLEEGENPLKAAELYRKAMTLSLEFEGKPLEIWEKEILRIDLREVGRRIDALERGHFPSNARGQ
jgi:O-antigen ligase